MSPKSERDIESAYTNTEFVAKLRRLADSVESGKRFEIQIGGERIYVPASALFTVEHERSEVGVEFRQLAPDADGAQEIWFVGLLGLRYSERGSWPRAATGQARPTC
jgi:amphi-Trp domain-containing protein